MTKFTYGWITPFVIDYMHHIFLLRLFDDVTIIIIFGFGINRLCMHHECSSVELFTIIKYRTKVTITTPTLGNK